MDTANKLRLGINGFKKKKKRLIPRRKRDNLSDKSAKMLSFAWLSEHRLSDNWSWYVLFEIKTMLRTKISISIQYLYFLFIYNSIVTTGEVDSNLVSPYKGDQAIPLSTMPLIYAIFVIHIETIK